MKVFDTNHILRYLVNDEPEQTKQVIEILNSEKVLVFPEVIAEVVYVMKNFYGCDRTLTAQVISDFICLDEVVTEHKFSVLKGLQFYRETSLDFVDCLLCAFHTEEGYEICTFDKKLKKLIARQDDK